MQPGNEMPGQPMMPGYMPAQPAPRRKRRGALIAVVSVLVVLGLSLTVAGLYARNVGPFKDSGLSGCEQIVAMQASQSASTSSNSDNKLTEAQYKQMRAVFSKSRYDDINRAGTQFIDLLWQISKVDTSNSDAALGIAFAYLGQITGDYSNLSGACGNHGVKLPPLDFSSS